MKVSFFLLSFMVFGVWRTGFCLVMWQMLSRIQSVILTSVLSSIRSFTVSWCFAMVEWCISVNHFGSPFLNRNGVVFIDVISAASIQVLLSVINLKASIIHSSSLHLTVELSCWCCLLIPAVRLTSATVPCHAYSSNTLFLSTDFQAVHISHVILLV